MEDLSNEIFYEIFDFLHHFHIYQAFYDLNTRFRDLLIHSHLPIKIDLLSLSESTWKRYNTDIIECNLHRISAFCISDSSMYDLALSPLCKILPFNRLECLILNNIESKCLENLLDHFSSLSSLSTLVITTTGYDSNKAKIYREIFRLRALKYCKLSLSTWRTSESLPISVDEYSPIEHLTITNSVYLHELDGLLSYVPQVRRLSLNLSTDNRRPRTQRCLDICQHLTYISVRLGALIFDRLEEIIRELFPMIEVLRLIVLSYVDQTDVNGHMWKQLITVHLPKLQIFDIQREVGVGHDTVRLNVNDLIN